MPGPPPKPASKRRRANRPVSYGPAEPTTAPAAASVDRVLGIDDAHPLITAMWDAVETSCEATFYNDADWQRLRFELWYANMVMRDGARSATVWRVVQHGLTEMLVSAAVKRRAGIELRPSVDVAAVEAVSMIGRYRQSLKPV
jgi:hypothetical protein